MTISADRFSIVVYTGGENLRAESTARHLYDTVITPDPGSVTWMPWGDPDYPKWLFYRHMIPVQSESKYDGADLFSHSIQKVVAGCWRACQRK